MRELLSTDDLAEFLQVPKKTIYAWSYRGQGPPSIRLGKHLRFRATDVAAWLEGRASHDDRGNR